MRIEENPLSLESELKKTKEELQQLKAGYDEFIHLAAHDLQAPVRKMTTLFERFQQKAKNIPEDAQLYLDRMNKCLDQMVSLVNDISALSHIKLDRENLQSVDLNEILLKAAGAIKGIEGHINIAKMPVVKGNPEDLKQLFIELFTNACKFKRQDVDLEIKVDAKHMTEEEKMIFSLKTDQVYTNISVHDNGIGFDQSMAERIFKPFQRLHGNATYKGNGIGLAICKRIVENMDGVIYATAKENEDATFSIILPEIQNL